MAYFVADEKLQGYYVSDGVTINIVKYHFECDDAASLPAQTAFITSKKVKISMASTAHTIDTDALYEMDSSGAWIQQSQPWQPLADYSVLSNKPQINGHTLTGNQSGADLGLQNTLTFDNTPTQNSTNPVKSGGIWTDQKRQETEIGVVANAGAKNIFDIQAKEEVQRATTVLNPDGGITISCNAAVWATRNVIAEIPAGDYICSLFVDAVTIGGGAFAFFIHQSDDQSTWTELARQTPITSISQIDKLITVTQKYLRIATNINNSGTSATNSATIRVMLRPAAITDPTFQPYAKTNRELTVLTDEDRAALAELVDGGAKNLLQNGEAAQTDTNWIDYPISIPAGTYVVYIGHYTSEETQYDAQIYFFKGTSTINQQELVGKYDGTYTVITTADTSTHLRIYASKNGTSGSGKHLTCSDVMVCSKVAWDISHAYQPYRPSWQEMYNMILALQ